MAADPLNFDAWLTEAKTANPGASELALTDYWTKTYGERYDAEQTKGLGSDTGALLKSGVYSLAASAREVGRRVFGEKVGDLFDNFDAAIGFVPEGPEPYEARLGQKIVDIEGSMSEKMREARRKDWWNDEEGEFGSAWTDPRAYYAGFVESLPGTVATMGPAGFAARSAGKLAFNRSVASGMSEEAAKAAAGSAIGRTAYVAGGLLEGAQQAGSSGMQVRQEIERMPQETLDQSEAYQSLVEQFEGNKAAARSALASDASAQAMLAAGTLTAVFGGAGDRILARAIGGQLRGGIGQRVLKGMVAEGALEEAPQGFFSQIAENIALQQADPTVPTMRGAIGDALGGAVVGALMGGAMAAPFSERTKELALTDIAAAQTPEELSAVAMRWSQEQTAAIATSLSTTLGLDIQPQDVFPSEAAGQEAVLAARARGESASFLPFEAQPPVSIEGAQPQTGVYLTRRAPLEGAPEAVSNLAFPTEEGARAIDPAGERTEIALVREGFAPRPVNQETVASNMAALLQSQEETSVNVLNRATKAAEAGNAKEAAEMARFAATNQQMRFEPVPDSVVSGAAFTRAMAETFGAEVQFIRTDPKLGGRVVEANGRRVLYVNVAGSKPHMQVAGHELSHWLERAYPELYNSAVEKLVPLFRDIERDKMRARYAGSTLGDAGINKELVGDLFGVELGNRGLWKELKSREPTLFRRLATRILEFLDTVLEMVRSGKLSSFNTRAVTDIKKARDVIADTLVAVARDQRARSEQAQVAAAAELSQTAEGGPPLADSVPVRVPVIDLATGEVSSKTEPGGKALNRVRAQLQHAWSLKACLKS